MSSSQQKPKTTSRASKDAGGGGQVKGRPCQEPHRPRPLKQDSSSPPSHHRSTGSLQFPKSPWFQSPDPTVRQLNNTHTTNTTADHTHRGGPSLSLFKHSKSLSVEEGCNTGICKRRGSEPARQHVDRPPVLTRARLPSDPGLKVSEADTQGGTTETRFCLSPYATKAVRDYFSSHPRSNPQSSQQVALALVESRREWLRRCSDPTTAEPDFEQLLFAEESFV